VGNHLQTAYLFIGGIFSVFYVTVGLMLCSGRISFGMEPTMRLLVGAGILLYGLFRGFVFYRKYKQSKEEQN
jgi:small-conductance mechanosensitive channel